MNEFNFQPAPENILAVSTLTQQIKRLLEGGFSQLWVRGEVSNCKRQNAGHIYFSLKDKDSQLPCVLFARDAMQQGFELKNGQEILVFGDLSVYKPHGRYQLIAKIALHSGQGQLQLEFERLKKTLSAEGLFDASLKKELPVHPKRIAVITSESGAAIRDFIQILQRRDFKGQVVVYPVRVQGKEAAPEIEEAYLHAANQAFDTIVLTRGGGSIEDLWPFNSESLARAIASSQTHTLSAVGHEIDHVLTDYVADLRAETPSGAAEILSSRSLELNSRLNEAKDALLSETQVIYEAANQSYKNAQNRLRLLAPDRQLSYLSLQVDETQTRFNQSMQNALNDQISKIEAIKSSFIRNHPHAQLQLANEKLDAKKIRFKNILAHQYATKKEQLKNLSKRLDNSDLHSTLRRGFALIKDSEGVVIDSASKAEQQDSITTVFHDGSLNYSKKVSKK